MTLVSNTREQIKQLNKIGHDKINQLTEHKGNYKQFNVALMDAYICLKPDCLSKICCSLFNCIVSTLWYYNPKSTFRNESEEKRIYSNILLTPEVLLNRYDPYKYKGEGCLIEKDIGNFVKRLQQIDEMNIFYMWRYGRPYIYMFVMERDIGLWKCFNDKAFVSPKTMKKIIGCSKGMIVTMAKMVKDSGRTINRSDIENSFGEFINRLISKMNQGVSKKLSLWKGNGNIFDYLGILNEELSKLNPYEGIEKNAESMANSLPDNVLGKLLMSKTTQEKEENMDRETMLELERDLIPDNENLISGRTPRKKVVKTMVREAKKVNGEYIDPFSNCNNLMKFYYACLKMYNDKAQIYSFDAERSYALEILDMLKAIGRKGDKNFLRSLIQYFIDNKLAGNNIYKAENTSMKSLRDIIPIYSRKYIG